MLAGDDMEHPEALVPPPPAPTAAAAAAAADNGDDAASYATAGTGGNVASRARQRIAMARETSVREMSRVGRAVGENVNRTVKAIDARVQEVSHKVEERARAKSAAAAGGSVAEGGGEGEGSQSNGGDGGSVTSVGGGVRGSLANVQATVGTSLRNLDEKYKVSETVATQAGRITRAVVAKQQQQPGEGATAGVGDGAAAASSPLESPALILNSAGCVARTLSVSDQHATVLLTHRKRAVKDEEGGSGGSIEYRNHEGKEEDEKTAEGTATQETATVVKSLLKLTVVPFHRSALDAAAAAAAASAANSSSSPPAAAASSGNTGTNYTAFSEEDERASTAILTFLSNYRFDLTSESGAEYSYWRAEPVRYPPTGRGGIGGVVVAFDGQEHIVKPLKKVLSQLGKVGKRGEESAEESSGGGGAGGGGEDAPAATPPSAAQQQQERPQQPPRMGGFTAELISPATERQIQRAMPAPAVSLVEETPDMYEAVTRPHIASITEGNSLDWIQNIVDGTKERERLLLDHDAYIVNIDTKWRSHPDPNAVPREEWLNHKSADDLYCLAILKSRGVSCLRDLRGEHLPALRSMLTDGLDAIERTYGVPGDQIRVFVHYQPQFYHFHVHYTRLDNEVGCQVERGHLLSDVVQNLESDSDFYAKRTVTYKLRVTDPLYGKIEAYRAVNS